MYLRADFNSQCLIIQFLSVCVLIQHPKVHQSEHEWKKHTDSTKHGNL
jgi:hypothetical protein